MLIGGGTAPVAKPSPPPPPPPPQARNPYAAKIAALTRETAPPPPPPPPLSPKLAAMARQEEIAARAAAAPPPPPPPPSHQTYISPAAARFGPIPGVTVPATGSNSGQNGGGGFSLSHLFGDVVHLGSDGVHGLVKAYNVVNNATNTAVDYLGTNIMGAGSLIQSGVNKGASVVNHVTDTLINKFETSPLGNNPVGRFVGSNVDTTVHFTTGVASGATMLVSGTVGAVGGVLRYASDSQFRSQVNNTIQTFAPALSGQLPTTPQAVRSYQAVQKVVNTGIAAFKKDPAFVTGQAVGVIGSTILTSGAGTAGKVGDVTTLLGDTGRGLTPVTDATAAGTRVADATTGLLPSGFPAKADPALTDFPPGATNVNKFNGGYEFTLNGKIYVKAGNNFTVRDGTFNSFMSDATTTSLRNAGLNDGTTFGQLPQIMQAAKAQGTIDVGNGFTSHVLGATNQQVQQIAASLRSFPVDTALKYAKNIYVVPSLGKGVDPLTGAEAGSITGLGGDANGSLILSDSAFSSQKELTDTLVHEAAHNLDVSKGNPSVQPGSPFGTGPSFRPYGTTNAVEDFAVTQEGVFQMLSSGLKTGDKFAFVRPDLYGPMGPKIEAILQQYGLSPYVDLRLAHLMGKV